MPQDPLQAELIQRALAAKSWADPANRPPRDTSAKINHQHQTPEDARMMQRTAIEDMIGVMQPRFNLEQDNGLMRNPDGSLSVVTDPQDLIRHILEHPEFYPPETDDPPDDEDAADNADEDAGERAMRLAQRNGQDN